MHTPAEQRALEDAPAATTGTIPDPSPPPQASRAEQMVRDRVAGHSLAHIGARHGLTGERVRQITVAHAPWRPWDAAAREHQQLIDEQQQVHDRWMALRPCVVCGNPVGTPNQAQRYCNDRCADLHYLVSYHLADGTRRATQRTAAARWVLRNSPNHPQRAHHERVLDNNGESLAPTRRWLVTNSKPWAVAVLAAAQQLPLLDLLDEPVQRQAIDAARRLGDQAATAAHEILKKK